MESLQSFFPVFAVVLGYLTGSLSFAVIVSRAMGLGDPRTFGSKNPGATNVLRSGSKLAAVLTLLLDTAKGWLPVVLIKWFGSFYGMGDGTMALVGLAAFWGHVYPVFFRFAGGKGVATALGVLLGLNPWLGLGTVLIWLLMAVVFRYSSLASITATVLTPVVYLLGDGGLWVTSKSVTLAVSVMALFLLYRHADNINRLIKGSESKLGKKASPTAAATAATSATPHAHGPAKHGHRHPPHATQPTAPKDDQP